MLGTKVLAANEVGDIGGDDRLSDRSKRVEPKTGRSKSQKSAKSQKLSKSGKSKDENRKNCQKVGIHLILILKIAGQAS